MKQLSLFMKGALIGALFSFLPSCSPSPECAWNADTISGSTEHAVLTLTGTSKFRDLEVEVQRSGADTRIYLNAYGMPFKPDEQGMVPVAIEIDTQSFTCQGAVLKGNQSIRLPEETESLLYQAIQEQKPLTIRAGRYVVEIQYAGFEKACKRFN